MNCPECRKPVRPGSPAVSRELAGGRNMADLHRVRVYTWHAECWADAERYAAESRSDAEEQRRAIVREFAAAHGLPDPYGVVGTDAEMSYTVGIPGSKVPTSADGGPGC